MSTFELPSQLVEIANRLYESGSQKDGRTINDGANELKRLQSEMNVLRDELIKKVNSFPSKELFWRQQINQRLNHMQWEMQRLQRELDSKNKAANYYMQIQKAIGEDDMLQSAWEQFIFTMKMRLDAVPGITCPEPPKDNSWKYGY